MKGLGKLFCLLTCVYLSVGVLQAQLPLTDTATAGVHKPRTDTTSSPAYRPPYFSAPRFTERQLFAPGILVGSGVAMDLFQGAKNTQLSFHRSHLADFHTAADNILLYVPAVIPYGLDLMGIPSKTDVANRTAILIKAEILVTATGYILKHSLHEWRPDGSNHYSFPSGHTLQAFATATLLSEEYRDTYKWMPYAAYGLASGIGLLRLANNKHYLGDVLVGAGLGILSMKLSYWTHRYKWHKHKITD